MSYMFLTFQRSEEKLLEQALSLTVRTKRFEVIDLKDRITYWNKGAERPLWMEEKDATSKKCL